MAADSDMIARIFDRLGSIDAKLEAGSKTHDRLAAQITKVDDRLDKLEPVADVVAGMKPIVEDYQANKNKAAGVILAISLAAAGLGFFASEVKAWILRLFH